MSWRALRSDTRLRSCPRLGGSSQVETQRSARGSPTHPSTGTSSPSNTGMRGFCGALASRSETSIAATSLAAGVRRIESQPGMSYRVLPLEGAGSPGGLFSKAEGAVTATAGAPASRWGMPAPILGCVRSWSVARSTNTTRVSSALTASRRWWTQAPAKMRAPDRQAPHVVASSAPDGRAVFSDRGAVARLRINARLSAWTSDTLRAGHDPAGHTYGG